MKPYLLVSVVAGLAGSALAQYPTSFDITTAAFGHEIGKKVATGWEAYYTPNPHSRKFATFGPYTTALKDGDGLVATRYVLKPDYLKTLKVTLDVYDETQGGVIAKTDISLYGGYQGMSETVIATLGYTLNASHKVQFRTGHWGTGTVVQCKTVHAMSRNQVFNRWSATHPDMRHQIGKAIGDYWEFNPIRDCNGANCMGGYISYGPYSKPNWFSNHTEFAVFNLALGTTSGGYPSEWIALVDVMENGTQIARREVVRSDFRGPYTMTPLALAYVVKPGGTYEYRVRYMAGDVIRLGYTEVWTPPWGDCLD